MKQYFVYILSNKSKTLYIGVTNNLERRIHEHKNGTGSSFTQKYNINRLVYYESYRYINDAIAREKQLKAGTRKAKVELIRKENKSWKDISVDFFS